MRKHVEVRLELVLSKYIEHLLVELDRVIADLFDARDKCRVTSAFTMATHVHAEEVVAETAPALTQMTEPSNVVTEAVHVKDNATITAVSKFLLRLNLSLHQHLLQSPFLFDWRVDIVEEGRIGVRGHLKLRWAATIDYIRHLEWYRVYHRKLVCPEVNQVGVR